VALAVGCSAFAPREPEQRAHRAAGLLTDSASDLSIADIARTEPVMPIKPTFRGRSAVGTVRRHASGDECTVRRAA
jgi:hypothetical protein